jgi:hypothetical protein
MFCITAVSSPSTQAVKDLTPNPNGPLKNPLAGCSKEPEARRAKFDELRRTLQYVEASRASATKHMGLFQQRAR